MATLNLPDSPHVRVWRLVRARLKADAVLKTEASGLRLVFFDGDGGNEPGRNEITDIRNYGGPVLRFLATVGGMNPADERSIVGALVVRCELAIPTLDDEDVLNVQTAIEGALYPEDNFVFHQSLIDAGPGSSGADTGEAMFPQPLSVAPHDAGRGGWMIAVGAFTIMVQRGFEP